ncbi:MAG: hypothetical protein WCJ09_21930 [Planctomycetota bacterium]
MKWRFIGILVLRSMIAAVLMMAVLTVGFFWMPYQREQRIERKIRSRMSEEHLIRYRTSNAIPQLIQDYLPIFRRITGFGLSNVDDDFSDLLPELKDLSELNALGLGMTRVNDAGLGYLAKLKNLTILELDGTDTTAEGRAKLRKALPNCRISPDP